MKDNLLKLSKFAPLVLGLVLSRLVPHPANFTPITAAALWSGSTMKPREAMYVLLGTMMLSDIFLGYDSIQSRMTVYLSLILTIYLGKFILKKKSIGRVLMASTAGTLSFFVITNFSVWLFSGMYAPTLSGLMNCYTMALPFLRNSATADFIFTGIFVGGWIVVKKINSDKLAVNSY